MQETGIIRYALGNMELFDIEGLARLSCECYEAVHFFRGLVEGAPASAQRSYRSRSGAVNPAQAR